MPSQKSNEPIVYHTKSKMLIRTNIPKSIVKQDRAPHRARARNGYRRRPPEPSTSRTKIIGSDKLGKTNQKEKFIKGTLQNIYQNSPRSYPKMKTNSKLVWTKFSSDHLRHRPSKIKKTDQEHITSVHEKNKGKRSGKSYINLLTNAYYPILREKHISNRHNNCSQFRTNFKDKLVNYWRNIPYNQLFKKKKQHCRIMGTIHNTAKPNLKN